MTSPARFQLAAAREAPPSSWVLIAAVTAQGDGTAGLALGLAILLLCAKLGGHLAVRVGQPSVLGELLAGILLGNLPFGSLTHGLHAEPTLAALGNLGAIVLLFQVGLESTVGQLRRVGLPALAVALLGVAAPLVIGFTASRFLRPDASTYFHLFLGAALCATSVGITARVLRDLRKLQTPEAQIILGAAVIDDVLGLVVLAVVAGAIAAANGGEALGVGQIAWIVGKALGFLVGALVLGVLLAGRIFQFGARLKAHGVLLAFGLGLCFIFSWLAEVMGLAPIVGAFAAGLVLEEKHTQTFTDRGELSLQSLVESVAQFLVPLFFVQMGLRTDLRSLVSLDVGLLALALTVAAVLGKQACGLGTLNSGADRLTVGLGMIPRGEVGLIFANMGLTLSLAGAPLLSASTYAALVAVVVLTTVMTPPLLSWMLRRLDRAKAAGHI